MSYVNEQNLNLSILNKNILPFLSIINFATKLFHIFHHFTLLYTNNA